MDLSHISLPDPITGLCCNEAKNEDGYVTRSLNVPKSQIHCEVYIYTYVYVHVSLCTILLITIYDNYICAHVCTHVLIYTYVHIQECTCIYVYIHTYIHKTDKQQWAVAKESRINLFTFKETQLP